MLTADNNGFINIGSCRFRNVRFPLVVGARRFELKRPATGLWLPGALTLDVWVDLGNGDRLYEVLDGKPVADNTKTNATGIVTFSQVSGRFAFKYRPAQGAKGGSVLFGPSLGLTDLDVTAHDTGLYVNTNAFEEVTVEDFMVGILIGDDYMVIGSNSLIRPRSAVA